MRADGQKPAVRLFSAGAMAGLILLSACATTTAVGDAGCVSYGEARLAMPRAEPLVGSWGEWVADLDDRMTGACR